MKTTERNDAFQERLFRLLDRHLGRVLWRLVFASVLVFAVWQLWSGSMPYESWPLVPRLLIGGWLALCALYFAARTRAAWRSYRCAGLSGSGHA